MYEKMKKKMMIVYLVQSCDGGFVVSLNVKIVGTPLQKEENATHHRSKESFQRKGGKGS